LPFDSGRLILLRVGQRKEKKMGNEKEIKVGDYVNFKYDVEQSGKVVKIKKDRWDGTVTYSVIATEGGYVRNMNGVLVELRIEDIW
jgi:hypothetical protein